MDTSFEEALREGLSSLQDRLLKEHRRELSERRGGNGWLPASVACCAEVPADADSVCDEVLFPRPVMPVPRALPRRSGNTMVEQAATVFSESKFSESNRPAAAAGVMVRSLSAESLLISDYYVDKWRSLVEALSREPFKLHADWHSEGRDGSNNHLTNFLDMTLSQTSRNFSALSSQDSEVATLRDEAPARCRAMRPNSAPRLAWDLVGVLVLVHDIIMLPLGAFSASSQAGFADYYNYQTEVNLSTAVFWSVDIAMSFFTGFFSNDGVVERGLGASARKYVRSYFVLDLVLVLIDWAQLMTDPSSSGLSSIGKTVSRFTRLLRLLRFFKMGLVRRKIRERIKSEYMLTMAGIVQILLVMLVLNHYVACSWFGLSISMTDTEPTWVAAAFGGTEDIPLGYAYTTSLHWSLTQFTPASMDIVPRNFYERLFNIVVIIMALVFFSSFVSSITNAMTHIRDIKAISARREEALRAFFSEHQISPELMGRIWQFHRLHMDTYDSRRWTRPDDVAILQMMPENIKGEIQEEVLRPVVAAHPLFQAYNSLAPSAVGELCRQAARVVSLSGGKKLFETWDVVEDAVFVATGVLEYHCFDDAEPLTLARHEWACEAAIWMEKVGLDGPLVAAANGCDAVVLCAAAVRRVVASHRTARGMVRRYAQAFGQCFNSADTDPLDGDVLFNDPSRLEGLVNNAWDAEYGWKTRTSTFATIQAAIKFAAMNSSSTRSLLSNSSKESSSFRSNAHAARRR